MRPPEKVTVTEWACKYRDLGQNSGVKGLYPIELTPFFRGVMDRCADPDVDQQVLMAPAQIGKTVALVENVAGYYLHQDPSSIMVVLADEDTAKYVASEKLAPMFRDSSRLSEFYDKKLFTQKIIDTPNGGHIDLAWSSSVSKLASRPERIVIADEVDKPGYSVGRSKEASAISLLKERVKSYPAGYYKLIFLSTPTIKEGNITSMLLASDIVYDWHVPCPFCGVFQPLRWNNQYCFGFDDGLYFSDSGEMKHIGGVVWDGGSDATDQQILETSRYQCGSCEKKWTTADKNSAVSKGKEVPRIGSNMSGRRIGNHINRIYSMMDSGKIENLVMEWVSLFRLPKERHYRELQGFINSALAEPFSLQRKMENSSESQILSARVELTPQTVPQEATAIVAFIDCQKYEFWFCVRAFAPDFTSWLIHYGRLNTFEDVEKLLFETSYPQIGSDKRMKIWRAGIDTGGTESSFENVSMTEASYQFVRSNSKGKSCRVWGTKGSSSQFAGSEILRVGKPLEKTPSGKSIPGGMQLILLDTHKLKIVYHARLSSAISRDEPGRPAYLHSQTGSDYAKQILAEELRVDESGREVWQRVGKDNHLFDCEIGCIALADPEWPGGGVNLMDRQKIAEATIKNERRVISKGIDIYGR